MKVLLLGGAGYIGGYASCVLSEKGHDVTIFGRGEYSGSFRYIRGDITDIQAVIKAGYDADCIVILAGAVGDPVCEADPEMANTSNNIAVKNICEIFNKRHIILFSSCAVYGAQEGILKETSQVDPISVYARTKVEAEKHIMAVGGTIFRLGSVYGIGCPSSFRIYGIVNYLVKKAVCEGKIMVMGGDQWKSLISVKDIGYLLEEAVSRNIRGLYNISDKNYTVRRIAKKIISCLPETKIIFGPARSDDRNYRVDNSRREYDFNYIPLNNLRHEIFQLADFFREQLKQSNV